MNNPYYAYDTSTQMTSPIFVVYDENHVRLVLAALFGHQPERVIISRQRLHKHDSSETYVVPVSTKRKRKR